MQDAAGNTVFDGVDIRTYEFGIRDRFVIANVYGEENGKRVHTAVQLMGFDVARNELVLSGFWPWQATPIADASASIETRDSGARYLKGVARPAGQDFPLIEFECEFETGDLYRCVAHSTDRDGTRYPSNVETSKRVR